MQTRSDALRVVLADDHALVRSGIARLLEDTSDIEVVAEFGDGASLLEAIPGLEVDVVIVDVSMPGPGFLELLRSLRRLRPAQGILVLSAHLEAEYAARALQAGADGYLTKGSPPDLLEHAVRRVATRELFCDPSFPLLDVRDLRKGAGGPLSALSEREFQVFERLAAGESGKAIAHQLAISPKTVSTYRRRTLSKLGVTTNADLVRLALELAQSETGGAGSAPAG